MKKRLPIESDTKTVGSGPREATFEYLGCAGWFIRCGDDAVLTAPFFSNPHWLRLLLPVAPKKKVITHHLKHLPLHTVRAVIAGHAHYDHIMDLPVVLPMLPPGVPVFYGDTVRHTLGLTGDPAQPQNVRITPIPSEHAPHVRHFGFFKGHYTEPLTRPPRRPSRWLEGEVYAYLIEFTSGDRTLRIYYNDTAPSYPHGLPANTKVDVAIFAVASFKRQAGYPQRYVDALQPDHIFLGHWENLFRAARKPMKKVFGTNVQAFIDRLPAGKAILPDRHLVITVRY